MAEIPQTGQKCLTAIVVPQVGTKMREMGKREKTKTKTKKTKNKRNKQKNLRMSKENALIYMHMYICSHPQKQTYIKTRHTYSHKNIMCYSSQIVVFDMFGHF